MEKHLPTGCVSKAWRKYGPTGKSGNRVKKG
jgi:hypothetical protein